jgi:hypothetical protein
LFITENCFSRDSTAESSGLSGADLITEATGGLQQNKQGQLD